MLLSLYIMNISYVMTTSVKFPTKRNVFHYVGQVIGLAEYGEFEVKFLRHSTNGFNFPSADDISTVSRNDIEYKLHQPISVTGTSRLAGFLKFNVKFDSLNIK